MSDTRLRCAFFKNYKIVKSYTRRFRMSRNGPTGIHAWSRNEPRTRFRRTLKWVSKWWSRPSPARACWPDQHIYERHFVPDEVGVYVCEQHRPVGLEVPEAFWNDVVGRGRFWPRGTSNTTERPRPERRLVPLISALANCSIILNGRWPIVWTRYQL